MRYLFTVELRLALDPSGAAQTTQLRPEARAVRANVLWGIPVPSPYLCCLAWPVR